MPRPLNLMKDPVLLEAALEGLLLQRERIETQIREIRGLLGRRPQGEPAASASGGPAARKRRRTLSPAARKRIAAAQKKRWAEYRKQTTQPAAAGKRARPRKSAAKQAKAPAKEA